MNDQQTVDWFIRKGLTPPSHVPHLTEEEIRAKMKRLSATQWRQEGNKLIAKTEMGELVNFIPTNLLLKGVDAEGLPILEKIQ